MLCGCVLQREHRGDGCELVLSLFKYDEMIYLFHTDSWEKM